MGNKEPEEQSFQRQISYNWLFFPPDGGFDGLSLAEGVGAPLHSQCRVQAGH